MESLSVWALVCLSMLLSVHVKASDLEERELQLAERIRQLREENPAFAARLDMEFAHHFGEQQRQSFVCQKLAPSPAVPTSVHKLRPGDIKVVAALGDSLTAGRGVEGGLLGLLIDYRGYSWSIGGQNSYSEMSTLPNILRIYNPNLRGYSEGTGSSKARFNVAISGAKSSEALEQAQELVRRMKADSGVNMAQDWKLITIFIGANDLCDWCEDEAKYSAANYRAHLQSTLDYLIANVPRALVNLVEMMQVDFVTDLAKNFLCQSIQSMICNCAANPNSPADEAKLVKLREEYQAVGRELAASSRYTTRDDFAVVLQPFYRNTTVPTKPNGEVDLSYFATDCFHLSKKGQVAAAEALWNNLVEPVGSKRTAWTPGEAIECPTEAHPFLYTNINSK